MKKRIRKIKRQKFWLILLKSEAVALIFACLFAIGFQTYVHNSINYQISQQLDNNISQIQQKINKAVSENESNELIFNSISSYMSIYTNYDVWLNQFPLFDPQENHTVQIVPQYSNGCHAISQLYDSDGNMIASNRQKLIIFLMFEKNKEDDPERGFFICDDEKIDNSELSNFIEEYSESSNNSFVSIDADSIYINLKDHSFIPHTGVTTKETYETKGFFKSNNQMYLIDKKNIKEETKEFNIDINDPDYVLTKVYKGISNENNPRYALFNLWGENKSVFNLISNNITKEDESTTEYQLNNDGTGTFTQIIPININQENYSLTVSFIINYYEPELVFYYWKYTILVATVLIMIALLYSWRRNVVNKAKYAMEDFQRDLTNNLAHDIKTPLTAIGGYAENILDGELTEKEKQRYLHSIINNVSLTDAMISKTLQLNSMDSVKLKSEKINIENAIESVIKKYEKMLDEKNISLNSSGSAEVKAYRVTFESIIENLILNAIKYTANNGSIKTELTKKHLIISNTVTSKIDVSNLKQPFVRGDASRSNVSGSGLGLSIADRAAAINGMTLKLSCSEREFRAELKF